MPSPASLPSTKDLATLPKAHLHLHFTGSMRPSTLLDLAKKNNIHLPQALKNHAVPPLDNSERGWFRFQRLYDAARSVVREESDMRRLIREAAEDDAAEGSGWLELQIDPTSYAGLVGGITPALEIVLDEAAAASRDTACDVAIIVAASRIRHPLDARTLARLAAQHVGDGPGTVVGFGLSNDERRGWTRSFGRAFRIARDAGLMAAPHSGELLGPDHVRTTVAELAPDRLGHGIRSAEDPQLLAELVERGIALEVCPTSNVALGVYPTLADVPLRTVVDAGAQVALSADDPLLFGSRLNDQYQAARDHHGFTDHELADLAKASIRASRASTARAADLLAGVDDWLRA